MRLNETLDVGTYPCTVLVTGVHLHLETAEGGPEVSFTLDVALQLPDESLFEIGKSIPLENNLLPRELADAILRAVTTKAREVFATDERLARRAPASFSIPSVGESPGAVRLSDD